MPRRLRRCGFMRVTSAPAKAMRPPSGATSPVIRLKSVDFPAPFGPMTASASPSATDSVMPSATLSAPYDLSTRSSSSNAILRLQRLDLARQRDVLRRLVVHDVQVV